MDLACVFHTDHRGLGQGHTHKAALYGTRPSQIGMSCSVITLLDFLNMLPFNDLNRPLLVICAFCVLFPGMSLLLLQNVVFHGVLAIENDTDFFERNLAGLRICEVHNHDCQNDDYVDDKVVLPADVLESYWVLFVEALALKFTWLHKLS